jgi:hypothetical protein
VRGFLDEIYGATGTLAAFFLVGTLIMVVIGVAGRLLDFNFPAPTRTRDIAWRPRGSSRSLKR